MSAIVIDGLNEEEFRRSIENRLREGRTGAAIERIRTQLAAYAGPGGILPERFLTVAAADLVLGGWGTLGDAVRRHDLPGHPVTALSIAFGCPGEDVADPGANGHLKPHIEVSYFSDDAYPFSRSGRDDLLEGYSYYGCNWSGDCVATDTALWLDGVEELHGALAELEAGLLASDEPDEHGIRAGSLGACLLSALLIQAIADRIARDGLPRPLCVMAGSNGVYPYFDAPVAGTPEDARKAAEAAEDFDAFTDKAIYGGKFEVPAPHYSSLLVTGIPRGKKRAVLVLDESEADLSDRLAKLRGLNNGGSEGGSAAGAETSGQPPTATDASPLLTKKPASQAWDFRDLLGPHQPEPEPSTPAAELRSIPDEAIAGPGFVLLESDLQQRLQDLIAGKTLPMAPAPVTAARPAPLLPPRSDRMEDVRAAIPGRSHAADGAAQPASAGLRSRLSAWWRGNVDAFRARLGR